MRPSGGMSVSEVPRMSEVRVVLEPASEASPEDAERLAVRLRRELRELDRSEVKDRGSVDVSPPDGAKGVDASSWATILVTLSSGGVLAALVGTLRDWLGRQKGNHKVSVTIDGDELVLDRATAREQSKLVEAYLRRHRGN
jgi:hypothetical protein